MVPIQSIEKTPEGSRIKTQIAASYKLAGTAREYHEVVDFVDSALINVIEGIDTPGKWAVNHKAGKIQPQGWQDLSLAFQEHRT
jgi:hypothetical protein